MNKIEFSVVVNLTDEQRDNIFGIDGMIHSHEGREFLDRLLGYVLREFGNFADIPYVKLASASMGPIDNKILTVGLADSANEN